MRHESGQGDSHEWFLTTQWSVVITARDLDDSNADQALGRLCETYWRPLYAFLRRSGHSQHDAQDVTQAFFATLIDKDYLKSVDRQKGKFRSFLLAAIKHFASNQRASRRAAKRGGKLQHWSIDFDQGEQWYSLTDAKQVSPEYEFEYRWAITVLENALAQVREEFRQAGQEELFDLLKPFLAVDQDLPSYQELQHKLNLGESGVRSRVSRLRKQYRHALRQQVAQTVGSQEDIDSELQDLMSILSRG